MEYKETLPRRGISRKAMMKRVARFKKLKGTDGGLPDSKMPGCERILYNVIGFQPPRVEKNGKQSPVGDIAARLAAIKISEGFNLGYCRALPGKGPMLHNHDTNETFIAMTGTWRASWENERGRLEHVDLKPLDLISFPPGARELGERTGQTRARGPEAARPDLVPARRFAPLHERDQGPEEQAFDPNVRDRRQRAERRVHERIDAQNRCGGRDAAAAENSAVRSAR